MFRYGAIQAVIPHAKVQRGSLDDPLILRVDAKTVGVFDDFEWRGPDRDRLRYAVPEGVGPCTRDLVLIVVLPFPAEVVLLQKVPNLQAVRSRNVGGRDAAVVLVDKAARIAARPDVVVRIRAVDDVQGKIRHAYVI